MGANLTSLLELIKSFIPIINLRYLGSFLLTKPTLTHDEVQPTVFIFT